jgi:hypothetical protein
MSEKSPLFMDAETFVLSFTTLDLAARSYHFACYNRNYYSSMSTSGDRPEQTRVETYEYE